MKHECKNILGENEKRRKILVEGIKILLKHKFLLDYEASSNLSIQRLTAKVQIAVQGVAE